jgi:HD-like signal output (HDOD) protein
VQTGVRLKDEEFDYLCAECHQEFGELIADAWKLPEDMRAVIRDHHSEPAAGDPLAGARWHVLLADTIVGLLGYTPAAPVRLLETPAVRALELEQRVDFIGFLERLPAEIESGIGGL